MLIAGRGGGGGQTRTGGGGCGADGVEQAVTLSTSASSIGAEGRFAGLGSISGLLLSVELFEALAVHFGLRQARRLGCGQLVGDQVFLGAQRAALGVADHGPLAHEHEQQQEDDERL